MEKKVEQKEQELVKEIKTEDSQRLTVSELVKYLNTLNSIRERFFVELDLKKEEFEGNKENLDIELKTYSCIMSCSVMIKSAMNVIEEYLKVINA